MKNLKSNKGFTLVELIAVIVILIAVIAIAVPTITRLLNRNKEEIYKTKIDVILKQAKIYAKDNTDFLYESSKRYGSYVCNTITVKDLLDAGYLDDVDEKEVKDQIIRDPRNNNSLNDEKVMLYIKSENDGSSNYSTVGIYVGPIISTFKSADECL